MTLTHEEWMIRTEEVHDALKYLTGPQGRKLPVRERMEKLKRFSEEAVELAKNAPSLVGET